MTNRVVSKEKIHFKFEHRGRKCIKNGPAPNKKTNGKIPRLSRLMALAIRFDDLIRKGGIENQVDLAQLGHVSRARVTQIMNLLHLAPDIQEQILFLPRWTCGKDPYPETQIRPIVQQWDWGKQREMWQSAFGQKTKNMC